MDWLPDLLKNLSISRSFAGALFLATLATLVLPGIAPSVMSPVPNDWRWLVGGLCIFSGSLLLFALAGAVFSYVARVPSAIRNNLPPRALTDLEKTFLVMMGSRYPNSSLNLAELNHSQFSKLELLQMCKELDANGLVSINPYSDDLVSLTDRGREKALQLSRQAKA